MHIRRSSVEHSYGTIKAWMGATHFSDERAGARQDRNELHVRAYNFRRLLTLLGMTAMLSAIRVYARFSTLFGRLWDLRFARCTQNDL
jgi:transposase